jgi:eukaryotic-like serine/threonine-protein kinase
MEDLLAYPQAGEVEAIFTAALSLATAERTAYLSAACGNNVPLRQRVEALLRAHEEAEGFLPEAPKGQAAMLLLVNEKIGDKIGHYRLREKIGEGGCGMVYVAEQEDPVRRRVALKLVKLGMDTREVVARFEAERQALALMDHPNIARVFDGGATDTGRPYFVLELVRGVRITDFCDRHQMPTVERLKLFIQICHAIQHAHQKGIIHRDIKPSNILVSLHDGVPVPKVIDFGIAKAVGERLTDKTLYTRFEQFLGTPAYMSPEQAGRSDLDIDTRSDIYALGVLLYELLTGRPPFDPKQLAEAGLEEMVRCIREQEPLRPSTQLNKLQQEELTNTAQQRGTEPPKLISLLRGDLDWIVMKCLEKDPTRRYEAANALARDIECYLSHEPITARPPSKAYRAEKFVRRNKVAVVAGTMVAATLVLGIIGSMWQMVRAMRAEQEQSRLRQDAVQARQVETELRKQAQAQAYASDMRAAQVALLQDNRGMALRLLRQHLPKPDAEDLRGLEWQYLWQECRGDEHKNFPHPTMVYNSMLSPDGLYLATASHDNKVRVWDVALTRQIQEFETPGIAVDDPVSSRKAVGFSPDGKHLAILGTDGVAIRETTGWSIVKELRSATAPVAFSADGRFLFTGCTNGMQLWTPTDWSCRVLTGAFATGNGFALTPDATTLACYFTRTDEVGALAQARIEVWDVRTGAKREMEVSQRTLSLAISSDGKWLAYGNDRGEVGLWDLPAWVLAEKFKAHRGMVYALAFSPDGKRLATGAMDQQIRIWETGTTNLLGTRTGHLSEIWSLDFSKDGKKLVSSSMDGTAKLWEAEADSARSRTFNVPTNSWITGPLPDRSGFMTIDFVTKNVHFWSLPNGELIRALPFSQIGPQGQVSIDVLTIPVNQSLVGVTTNGLVHFLNPSTGELLRSVQVAATNFLIWSISRDQRWILGCLPDSCGMLCDLRKPSQVQRIPDFVPANGYGAFSPDNRWLAYATKNHEVTLWDLAANRAKALLKGHRWRLRSLAFSPDGKWLASGGSEGDVWLWSVQTAKPLFQIPLKGHMGFVLSVAFSVDNRTLATFGGDQTMRWWSVATGREVLSFPSEPYWGADPLLDFPAPGSLTGRLLFFYERSGRVRTMTVPTLAEIDAAESHPSPVGQSR